MASLVDYLDVETVRRLEDALYAVAKMPVWICGPDGRPILPEDQSPRPAPPAGDRAGAMGICQVPVLVDGEVAGHMTFDPSEMPAAALTVPSDGTDETFPRAVRFLGLMAGVIGRLCEREKQLRVRVDELATLYRLTSEFTGQRDLQGLLDLVTRTVVDVLKAKACFIRLLNEDRTELVVKSVCGLSKEYLSKGPVLVSQSVIDQEVLSKGKPVTILDERNDPRILYPEATTREGIVSALCAPLMYRGKPEGVIRVYTAERHEFDWFEISLLQAIAGDAAAAIVNARLYQEAVTSAAIRRQLQLAGEVQRRMIPTRAPQVPGFQVATLYVPSYELGGDFYDFIDLPPDNMGIAICDVVGKGVRASLLMASIRASLRAHAMNVYSMSQVLGKVNRDLCADTLTNDFATLFYGVLDWRTRRLTYANAGHPSPLLLRDGKAQELSAGGGLLGIYPEWEWAHEVVDLRPGDVLLAYTDGLSEALNFEDEAFGRARVEKAALAATAQGQTSEGILKHLLWEMRRFAGLGTGLDDLSMIAIKATG